MIERHQAIVKERAGGGESFVIEAGAGGEPCVLLSPRGDIGASNPVQANWGGGFQAISPYCHRSHIETDKPKSVRFFKLILGWRHRRTTVSLYKKFMPSGFLPYRSLMPSGRTSTLRSTPRIASPQAWKCPFPRISAKRGKPAAGIHVCNSSLGRMK